MPPSYSLNGCALHFMPHVDFNIIKNGLGTEKGEFHTWVLFSHAFGLNTCKICFETNSSAFKEFYDKNHKWDSPGFTVSSPVVRWALICQCHFGQPFCPAVGFIKDTSLTLPSTLKFSSNKVNLRCFRLNHAVKCLRGSLLIKICSAAENTLSLQDASVTRTKWLKSTPPLSRPSDRPTYIDGTLSLPPASTLHLEASRRRVTMATLTGFLWAVTGRWLASSADASL